MAGCESYIRQNVHVLSSMAWFLVCKGLMNVLVGRGLGPEGFGTYTALFTTSVLLGQLGLLGLDKAASYFAVRPEGRPVVTTTETLALLMAPCLSLVQGVLVLGLQQSLFRDVPRNAAILSLLVTPFFACGLVFAALLMGQGRFKISSRMSAFQWTLSLALVSLFLWLGRLTISAALLALLFSLGVTATTMGWWARRAPGGGGRPSWRLMGELLRYGLGTAAVTATGALNYRLDFYLLQYFASGAALGIYAAAVSICEAVVVFAVGAGQVLLPRIASEGPDGAARLMSRASRVIAFNLCVVALVLWAWGPWALVLVFGPSYEAAGSVLLLLLPGMICRGITTVLTYGMYAQVRQGAVLASVGLALVGSIALNILLIPRFGFSGAAAVSSVSNALSLTTLLLQAGRGSGIPVRRFLIPEAADWDLLRRMLAGALHRATR